MEPGSSQEPRTGGLIGWLDRTFYPGVGDHWDDALLRDLVLGNIDKDTHLLDLGAGAGIVAQMDFKALVRRACGVDVDPRVMQNPFLHEARIGSGTRIPYAEGEFDVVVADNVLEHLEDPIAVFREVARVLRPRGLLFVKTPNRCHYMPIIAQATPLSFHRLYNRWRGRDPDDTFPTYYRANSRRRIEALGRASGLHVDAIRLVESRPQYLRLTALTYAFGIAYERTVNATSALANGRIVLLAQLSKPSA